MCLERNKIESAAAGAPLRASLPAFAIAVQALATGSATLSWTPPTQNSDGSPLVDLAGYKIYWGTASGSYTSVVQLGNPGLATYVVDGLASGATYYFAVSAFNRFATSLASFAASTSPS